ncbi:unnamed protein product [Prunus armeniaca]|uniref:Alcohol dehydrogenase-like N-terminal domain-containing protein n=1 Tax=Prunus armeniaca TaxID=36596 RepID=A0A6J5XJG3_PRUAR|nr:unnamed protein product [Prunus armeniaca]
MQMSLPCVKQPDVITCEEIVKAAVAWGAGKPLVIEEVNVNPPQAMEIRIKVVCTSLFRSDITAWESLAIHENTFSFLLRCHTHHFLLLSLQHSMIIVNNNLIWYSPVITFIHTGEEPSIVLAPKLISLGLKIVESVGQGITEFTEGDHVLTVFIGVCGKCRQCTSGKSNICVVLGLERRGVMHCDQRTRFSINGEPIYHYCAVSSFSEYTVVHSGCAVKISSVVPLEKVIKNLTGGGADYYSFECIGDTGMGWGLTVTLGVPKVKPEVTAHYGIFLTGRTLKGSLFGGWKPKSDLPSLVDMYTKKEIQVEEYITHNLPFEDVNKAFNLMREGKCLRCVIHMAKSNFSSSVILKLPCLDTRERDYLWAIYWKLKPISHNPPYYLFVTMLKLFLKYLWACTLAFYGI